MVQPVRDALAALDPDLPFTEIHTLAEDVSASIARERLTAALASFFGALAGLLAAVGIDGLLSSPSPTVGAKSAPASAKGERVSGELAGIRAAETCGDLL